MKFFIQRAAERDILHQVAWYAEQGGPDVARRFSRAVQDALRFVVAQPQMGKPKETRHPVFSGLRSWAIKGFPFRVYYLIEDDVLRVVRVLHAKQDADSLLEGESR